MRALLASGAIFGMALSPWAAFAAPLDGSAPMLCSIHQVLDCEADNCERTTAEEAKVPPFVRIDVQRRVLSSVDGARTSPIARPIGPTAVSCCRGCRTSVSGAP